MFDLSKSFSILYLEIYWDKIDFFLCNHLKMVKILESKNMRKNSLKLSSKIKLRWINE